jgi:hypothetical protein
MWVDYLSNGRAVREAFGESIPELRGLELVQLVLDPAGDIALTLGLGRLPDNVPGRWKDKGFDKLQLRMRFAIGAFAIRRDDALGAWKVSIELEGNRLHVISEDGLLELTAGFLDARLDFHPYRAAMHEFPPTWYHL